MKNRNRTSEFHLILQLILDFYEIKDLVLRLAKEFIVVAREVDNTATFFCNRFQMTKDLVEIGRPTPAMAQTTSVDKISNNYQVFSFDTANGSEKLFRVRMAKSKMDIADEQSANPFRPHRFNP